MKLVLGLALVLLVSPAYATPVLDQSYFDPNPTLFAGFGPSGFEIAQTLTVGAAGLLNSVDILGSPTYGSILNKAQMLGTPGSMSILATINGAFAAFASTNVAHMTSDPSGPFASQWVSWDFSSFGLFVTPGEILELGLALPLAGPTWLALSPGGYSGGSANFTDGGIPVDFFFRTFVGEGERTGLQPLPPPPPPPFVPKPSAIWLLFFGLVTFSITGMRRRICW